MATLIARFATAATLVLAAAPVASIASTAHAQGHERVRVADLNMATSSGKAVFEARVDHAARRFCSAEHNLTLKAACVAGVQTEAKEKIASDVQFASRV
ncbi:MAG TPA: UrcA family protein [Phenylobacterium sp.]|jgi:UrcA family protein|nr:UrcA family protein [Phenylobacterium sp.]